MCGSGGLHVVLVDLRLVYMGGGNGWMALPHAVVDEREADRLRGTGLMGYDDVIRTVDLWS